MGIVVVVGAVNVDLVVTAPRLPGPGETVVGPGMARHGGGKGANAAVAASRAGAVVRYVGAVGADDLGRSALGELRAEGIDVDGVAVLPDTATGVALIVVDEAGENQIAVGAGANAAVADRAVRDAVRDGITAGAACVLVSTEIPDEAVEAAVRAATDAGVRCVLNPAPLVPAVARLLPLGPLLTPNRGELADLAAAAGIAAGTDVERAEAVAELTGAPVAVTLGADGVLLVRPGEAPLHLPPHPTDPVDTTGAGDTFNGVLAAGLAAGRTPAEAAARANVAAALSVRAAGARAGMPAADAVDDELSGS